MSSLGIPEHLYAWRTRFRRNCALCSLRELRQREPRERADLRTLRKDAGPAGRSLLTTEHAAGVANGMPELSQNVSGRRQVLRLLWQAALTRGRPRSPATATEGGGPTHGSAGAPKGRTVRLCGERLPVLSCRVRNPVGAGATCLSKLCGFFA
jgi:hypothetical protein